MEVNNPLYKNQGIHTISCIFTVERGITKVLLIKRKNNPYIEMWALVGGALHNNEDLDKCALREIEEKTGISNIDLIFCNIFGKVDRSPIMRMVAVSYLGIIDNQKVKILKDTIKTSNAEWFDIKNIPILAYDHNEILIDAIEKLREKIVNSGILQSLFPSGFTIPEIQKTYQAILNKNIDRRNFRRKLLSLDLIEDTNEQKIFEGKKPAKFYKFKKNIKADKNLF